MRRLITLLLGAAAVAAAARYAIARSRAGALPAPAPGPAPTAPPVPPPSPAAAMPSLDSPAPDDGKVEREVEAQLASSPVAAEADVSVEVRHHIAQLEGTAPDPETAVAIADEAAHIDGVQGIDNRLRPEGEAAGDPETPGEPR